MSATSSEPLVIRKRRSAPREPVLLEGPAGPEPEPSRTAPVRGPRRLGRRRAPMWTTTNQALAALLCWASLSGIVFALDPEDAVVRAGFFLMLFGALFFTLAPLIRGVSLQFARSRLYQEAVGMHAARQALMVSAFVVLNALLQLQRAWNGLTAFLLFCVFAIIEIVALARR